MGLAHSPKTVTNGLVFAYDVANTQKSWKGKPTENLIAISGSDAGILRSGVGYSYYGVNINSAVQSRWTSVNNQLTLSFEGKRDYSVGGTGGGNDGYPQAYVYFSDWSWASAVGVDTYSWSRNSVTFTMPDPTGKTVLFDIYHMNASNPGFSYSRNHQVEFSTYATPFVNGTRTTAQAILDITRQKTITATSLTYASNGTFSFNGTSDYIDTGNTFTFSQSGQFSVEVWLKILDHSDRPSAAAGIIGKGHYYDNGWDLFLLNNNSIYFEASGDPTRQGLVHAITPVLALSTWHHCIATYNNGAMSVYLNGVLVVTQTYSGPGNFSNSNNVLIGRRFGDAARSLRGEVSVAKIYNVALTEAEVKQNFNARRGRYGV